MLISDICAELDVMCLIIMLMLTVKTVSLSKSLSYQKLYLLMMFDAMVLVISDMIYELDCSDFINLGNFALYLFNDLYFIASITLSYIWFIYSIEITTGLAETSRPFLIISSIPAVFLTISTPFNYFSKWVFYFDAEGYHRGFANAVFAFVPMGYFAFGCILAVIFYLYNKGKHTKELLKAVVSFAIIPIIAVCVQLATGLSFPAVCVGSALGMLQVFLTSIAREREELMIKETASKSKNEFFAGMSHEIRTPINAILGMNTMILREADNDNIRGYAHDVDNSGKLLLALINDILDISKIEAGKMRLVDEDYNTTDVIRDVVNITEARMKGTNLELKVEADENIPAKLRGDAVRLRQIILNIMTNGVKYTSEGYVKLTVGYRYVGMDMNNVILSVAVEDTGRGMKKEDIENLFSPYERFDETSNRKIEGTGLGMSITKQLLSLMGSEIKVQSEYGKGSIFSFEVSQPVVDSAPMGKWKENAVNAKAAKNASDTTFEAPLARVLVVDDTVVNLRVFKALLKRTRIRIDEVTSGAQALKLVKDNEYDMIFVDIMMPDMDGVETYHKMIEEDNTVTRSTPIVALTANALSGAKDEYLAEGFSAYLSKPIEPKSLEEMLLRYIASDKIEMK